MAGQLTEPGGLSGARSADEETRSDQALAAEAPTGSPSRFADRVRSSLAFAVALVAAITPVVVATVRAIGRDWLPSSDTAYLPLRAWDVVSSHPPLIGPPASASDQVGRDLYQPGALQYDLLAVPVRLFGRGPGTAVTIALVNVVAIVLIGWLLRRLLGVTAATVALAATALLVWSMGSEILYDPWATYSPLLAFALLMVAVWCAVAGDVVAWPVVIVAGSYVAQVHLSFAVLVAGLVVLAVVGCVLQLRQGRRLDPAGWAAVRAQAVRWGAGSIVLGLVCWSQPLWQQFFGSGEGNLGALARSTSSDLPTPGLSQALRTLGGTVALPPFWLPPSFGSPSFDADGDGVSLGLAVAALAVLVVALGMIGVRAHRRGAVALAAGAATAVTSLALGLATMLRVPLTYGLTAHYVRWMWPLGMVLWLVLALGGLEELRLARAHRSTITSSSVAGASSSSPSSSSVAGASSSSPSSPASPVGWIVAGAAALVAVVAGVGALPTAENGTSTVPWTSPAAHDLGPEMVAAVEGRGTVLVDLPLSWATILGGPPLLGELQDAGIPFRAEQEIIVRQLGAHYAPDSDEETVTLTVRGAAPEDLPGQRLVTTWTGLSDDQQAELERLTDQLADEIRQHGLRLDPEARRSLRATSHGLVDPAEAAADPEAFLASTDLWTLCCWIPADYAGHSLVDDRDFPPGLVERWADLAHLRDVARLSIYVSEP